MDVYAAGVFTISGTPTVAGTFNYTVTTTGTCVQTTALGSITVNPDATISLTSLPATAAQSLCINTAIAPITYTIGGGGTGAGVVGSTCRGKWIIPGRRVHNKRHTYSIRNL